MGDTIFWPLSTKWGRPQCASFWYHNMFPISFTFPKFFSDLKLYCAVPGLLKLSLLDNWCYIVNTRTGIITSSHYANRIHVRCTKPTRVLGKITWFEVWQSAVNRKNWLQQNWTFFEVVQIIMQYGGCVIMRNYVLYDDEIMIS